MIRADPAMHRIFEIVHQDEPDHFLPYRHWLDRRSGRSHCGANAWPTP